MMRDRIIVIAAVGGLLAFAFLVGMFQGVSLTHPDYLERVFSREHLIRSCLFAVFAGGVAGIAYIVRAHFVSPESSSTPERIPVRGPYVALLIGVLYVIFIETGGIALAALGFSPPVTYFGLAVDMLLWKAVLVIAGTLLFWLLLRGARDYVPPGGKVLVVAPTLAWFLALLAMAMHSSLSDSAYVIANALVAICGVWLASRSLAKSDAAGRDSKQ